MADIECGFYLIILYEIYIFRSSWFRKLGSHDENARTESIANDGEQYEYKQNAHAHADCRETPEIKGRL